MQRDKQEKRNNGVLLLPSLRIVASRCWKKVTGAHLASREVPSCNKVQKPNIHNDFGFGRKEMKATLLFVWVGIYELFSMCVCVNTAKALFS